MADDSTNEQTNQQDELARFSQLTLNVDIPLGQHFLPLKNDRILRAARKQAVDQVPIWLMRQAGRYLPEFREVRKRSDFFTVCRTPELACEVTLQPLRRFELDAAIIFSDILVIPQALGLEVQMLEKVGPKLPEPLTTPQDLDRLLSNVDVHHSLGYVFDAIRLTRHALQGKVPLIGFCGAPFTIMSYMIEGGGSKTYSKVKTWLYRYPDASHALLQRVTDISVDYLIAQAQAGAQLLQVFDSWAGELSPEAFDTFALPYLRQIATRVAQGLAALKQHDDSESAEHNVPLIVFARGAHYALESLSDAGYQVMSLDWTVTPASARTRVQGKVALQGNLDPCILYAPEEVIRAEARKMVDAFGTQGWIANLGHGMLPDHQPEAVGYLVDEIHSYSRSLIQQSS
eukprot:TRINITY_DN1032_c0_g2_i7.p1 TRINITY_DN1032_c0_g2~~TRINITY_DN1032_c0_g2_i7.p1  ORF type:complete len:401 (+),score=102.20 TRINITY_DN1032_c0_g2_i7:55-1257(+)